MTRDGSSQAVQAILSPGGLLASDYPAAIELPDASRSTRSAIRQDWSGLQIEPPLPVLTFNRETAAAVDGAAAFRVTSLEGARA